MLKNVVTIRGEDWEADILPETGAAIHDRHPESPFPAPVGFGSGDFDSVVTCRPR